MHQKNNYIKTKAIPGIIMLSLAGIFFGCQPKVKRPFPAIDSSSPSVSEITSQEVKQKQVAGEDFILLDVRQPDEYFEAHIEGARLIPLDQLDQRVQELDPNQEIIVYCRSGYRSNQAARLLLIQGFTRVKSMKGGILAWPYPVVK
jgi:rhodanese-related sulfurtransferase